MPTFTAIAVTLLLEKHFHHLVELKFTATMEQTLDDIAEGKAEWLPYLNGFFLGDAWPDQPGRGEDQDDRPGEARSIELPGMDAKVRIGRYRALLQQEDNGEATRVSIPQDVPPADLDADMVQTLLGRSGGPERPRHRSRLTASPCSPHWASTGRTSSSAKCPTTTQAEADVAAARGDPRPGHPRQALQLLSLPRLLGAHPETGGKVFAGLGRFGPYILHDQGKAGKDYRSLKGEDDVLTVALARALELLAQPKLGRGRRAEPKPLREVGLAPRGQGAGAAVRRAVRALCEARRRQRLAPARPDPAVHDARPGAGTACRPKGGGGGKKKKKATRRKAVAAK